MTEKDQNKTSSNINLSAITAKLMKCVIELSPDEKIALLRDLEERSCLYRRKSGRIPYLAEIDFAMEGRPVKGCISNISETGVYIESLEKPEKGSEITMVFPPPSKSDSVKVKGVVVRSCENGFAVEFKKDLNKTPEKHQIEVIKDIYIK